jgi:hypothetical protein
MVFFKQSVHFRGTRIMTHGHRRLLGRGGPAWFAAILGLLLVSATSSRADVMTFAQFTQINVGDQNFVYSNNTSSADFSTIALGNPISLGIADWVRPTGLASSQDAHLFLSASTASAVKVSGTALSQAFPSATNMIRILLDTPFKGHSNFLTVTFSSRADGLAGEQGTHSATFRASDASSPPDTVTYTSDVIDVSPFIEHSFALSFSSISGNGLQVGPGGFYDSFTASGSGTFDAAVIPEPPSLLLAGMATFAFAGFGLWRKRSANSVKSLSAAT